MMNTLNADLPEKYGDESGIIKLQFEEESMVWLWAKPGLLPWPNEIAWADSPVTGNEKWPGDLWGVDEQGELIVIEGKYAQTSDPFVDFVNFYRPNRLEFLSKTIRERWRQRYDAEINYHINGYEIRPEGKTLGILPRSSKRVCLRTWKRLAQQIDTKIRSEQYQDKVNSYLGVREEKGNHPPHFWGLLVHGKHGEPYLSNSGKESRTFLENKVGANHVHLTNAQASIIRSRSVLIEFREL